MGAVRLIGQQLGNGWGRASKNPVWSGVIAALIATTIAAAIQAAKTMLATAPPRVERAEVNGGPWGPSRVLFRCMPGGTCAAPDHVALDSIVNDPVVGNEAEFMSATVLGSHGSLRAHTNVKIGDSVLVRALARNDAAMDPRRARALTARDARFFVSFPTSSSSELPIIGHFSAANAVPRQIYATAFLRAKQRFSIEYVSGSATLVTPGHSVPLSIGVVGEGAPIGSVVPNGTLPPGLSNVATVLFVVRIVPPQPAA